MERHIFKFGNSSFAVVLPKEWVSRLDLQKSNSVQIVESRNGDLVLSTGIQKSREVDIPIRAITSPKLVGRWVWLHYIYGANKIRLHSEDGIKRTQVEAIEKEIKIEAPGFEIISQSEKDIIIEDLTNIKEVSLDKIISRIRSLINEEFKEIERGEYQNMERMEELVNRFYALGIRYINIMQAEDSLKSFRILQLLEAISDSLYKLTTFSKHTKMLAILQKEFELTFLAFEGDMKAIETIFQIREEVYVSAEKSKMEKLQVRVVKDISTYIAQISEFGLKVSDKRDIGMLMA